MGFVNEYVSQENVKKYELAEQFIRRNPAYKSLPENFKPFWTIDRGRNIYLMGAGMANQAQENECWIAFLLNCNGKEFLVKLERGVGSKKYSESPYLIVWDKVVDICPADLHGMEHAALLAILKEALSVVGDDGLDNRFSPKFIVNFNF